MPHFYYFTYIILSFIIRLNTLFQKREREKKLYENNIDGLIKKYC